MKTKIIYISGSEVFEMADVRAAFDQVRNALGLDRDTVLFGVPVDCDDALAPGMETTKTITECVMPTTDITPEPVDIKSEIPIAHVVPDITEPEITEEIQQDSIVATETVVETPVETIDDEIPAPVKKSRGRPRKAAAVEPADDVTPDASVAESGQSEKVIPILSVLAVNNANADTDADDVEPETEIAESRTTDAPVADISETIATPMDADDTPDENIPEIEDINDMIADRAPDAPVEKTLEQLLESMTPLREDHGENIVQDTAAPDADAIDFVSDDISPVGDADATLEQLAAEFATSADKIATPAPSQSHGKIGKLKNILPFKKARRDDTGLMGDLFGWAGVAANDDDFAMPGFFTTAAKK